MCGHGGIGRRVTLRSLWAKPVEVQVFLAAPIKNLPKVKKETREISQTYSNVPKKITSEQIRKKTCQQGNHPVRDT